MIFQLSPYIYKNIAKFYGMNFSIKSQFSHQQFSLSHTVFPTVIVLKLLNGKFHRVLTY